jgi:hypothetical protein
MIMTIEDLEKAVPMLRIETDREDDGRWPAEAPALPGVMTYARPTSKREPGRRRWRSASSPSGSSMGNAHDHRRP